MIIKKPYTYLIGWSNLNKWYYGVRVSPKDIPENDLWIKYFTSSKYVKQLITEYGNPDIIQIRKTFRTQKLARKWETKVLIRIKAKKSENWLNKSDGRYNGSTKPKSTEHKNKISIALSGLSKSIEHINKINKNPEKIKKTAEWHRGKIRPESTKNKLKEHHINRIKKNGGAQNRGLIVCYNPITLEQQQCSRNNIPVGFIQGNYKNRGKKSFYNPDNLNEVKRFLIGEEPFGWKLGNPKNPNKRKSGY